MPPLKVYVYPADQHACGHFRMIWPAQLLRALGHDVRLLPYVPGAQRFTVYRSPPKVGPVVAAAYPADADVMVFQRVCERDLVDLIRFLHARGVATVVDVDDYLTSIDPGNPAFVALHPRNVRNHSPAEPDRDVSFRYVHDACAAASLVTVTTPALVPRYAPHGRVAVLPNFLPDHYYDQPHPDSDVLGWPASFFSHPNDPGVTHGAVGRLVREGHRFVLVGDPEDAGRAFGLDGDPPTVGPADLGRYPEVVARELGVGIVPLADTVFNAAKSWLKCLELSALGVPWVASPRAEVRRLHALGAGVLADKPKQWYQRCRALLTDPALRGDLSQAGREVAAGLQLRDKGALWWDAWTRARELADAGQPLATTRT